VELCNICFQKEVNPDHPKVAIEDGYSCKVWLGEGSWLDVYVISVSQISATFGLYPAVAE
jgi:hypothetical protein